MNYEEIASAIEGYKEYFPEHFNDEKYKWEAVKHFQNQTKDSKEIQKI